MDDKVTTLEELKALTDKFRSERDWVKHHSPRNLSVSIAIEAAELMEKFQWGSYQDENADSGIKDELADIIIYCLYLASSDGIDISKAVERKITKAARNIRSSYSTKKPTMPVIIGRLKRNIAVKLKSLAILSLTPRLWLRPGRSRQKQYLSL